MINIDELKVCPVCGEEFKPSTKSQVYCSKHCKSKAEYRRKLERTGTIITNKTVLESIMSKCNREDCKMYNSKVSNNCVALKDLNKRFIDNCSFYKHK